MMKNSSMGFSLRDLQYIVAVAEELSFHKAALRCCVSQSTLSIQLKKCEAYLGIALFVRSHHFVGLTPAAVEIVALARVAIEAAELIKKHARGKSTQLSTLPRTALRARTALKRTEFDLKDQSRFVTFHD